MLHDLEHIDKTKNFDDIKTGDELLRTLSPLLKLRNKADVFIPDVCSTKTLVASLRSRASLYEALNKDGVFTPEGTRRYGIYPGRGKSPETRAAGYAIAQQDAYMVQFLASMIAAVEIGPKLYQPSFTECLALENTAAKIPIGEYRQPFPVMFVELPEAYSRLMTIQSRISENNDLTATCRPVTVIAQDGWKGQDFVQFFVLFSFDEIQFGNTITHCFVRQDFPEATMEEFLVKTCAMAWGGPDGQFYGATEKEVTARCIRVGINAMLMLTNFGSKLGPSNPEYHARLLAKCGKKNHHTASNRRELRMIPELYAIDQSIKLDSGCSGVTPDGVSEGTGQKVKPHWRRGHIRHQACGVGLSQRKAMYIAPVLVNRDLFLGKLSDTTSTYKGEAK